MRSALILMCSAVLLIASDSVARPDYTGRLTPKAAEAVRLSRQSLGAVQASSALAGAQAQGAVTGSVRQTTTVVVRPDGSLRAYFGEEHMNDMLAVKGSDGKVTATCAHGGGQHLHEHAVRAEVK